MEAVEDAAVAPMPRGYVGRTEDATVPRPYFTFERNEMDSDDEARLSTILNSHSLNGETQHEGIKDLIQDPLAATENAATNEIENKISTFGATAQTLFSVLVGAEQRQQNSAQIRHRNRGRALRESYELDTALNEFVMLRLPAVNPPKVYEMDRCTLEFKADPLGWCEGLGAVQGFEAAGLAFKLASTIIKTTVLPVATWNVPENTDTDKEDLRELGVFFN